MIGVHTPLSTADALQSAVVLYDFPAVRKQPLPPVYVDRCICTVLLRYMCGLSVEIGVSPSTQAVGEGGA